MPRSSAIKFRRGAAAVWTALNPTLAAGEPGFESDTGKVKIGDGSTAWTSLGYQLDAATAVSTYVPKSLVDAKGDLLSASAADTPARLAVGTAGQALIADSAETTGLKWGQSHFTRSATMPSGALMETMSRYALATVNPLVSGRLTVVAIDLPKGLTITSITFVSSSTALSVGSNQWFGLFDSSRVPLRLTADGTSTAWGATSAKTLALTSTFTTTYAGLHYVGLCIVASTCPTLSGTATHAHASGFAPILAGASSTGLTDPASCPNPIGAITAGANVPYAYVS